MASRKTAIREFGRIDTWVNNAAVSMYGRIMDLSDRRHAPPDGRELLGPGVRVAHRRASLCGSSGGALINVGSALSDRAIPLQGSYCAAKHALKAFTDALRMELEEEGVPISVTLVKPASIDTPFFDKARTYLGVEPQPVPPVYAPEVVSEVILHAAQHPLQRADRRWLRRQAECRTIRSTPRGLIYGALDVRFPEDRQACEQSRGQSV